MANPNISEAGKGTQFKKGESGNLKGRPKLPDLREVMAEILGSEKDEKTGLQKIIEKLQELAEKGNIKASEVLLSRGYGLPKEHKEITFTKPIIIDWSDNDTTNTEAEAGKEDS